MLCFACISISITFILICMALYCIFIAWLCNAFILHVLYCICMVLYCIYVACLVLHLCCMVFYCICIACVALHLHGFVLQVDAPLMPGGSTRSASILRIVHFPQKSPSYKYTQIFRNCLHINIYKYSQLAFIQVFVYQLHTARFNSKEYVEPSIHPTASLKTPKYLPQPKRDVTPWRLLGVAGCLARGS